MRCKFLHFSDMHLGYQQYGLAQRFNDFGRAFLHIVEEAIAQRVDFVLFGGDLFQKRAIDPPTLLQAIEGLRRLKDAHIPVLAVEGNHERAHYRDVFSWTDFLADQGYLVMLTPEFEDGQPVLKPHDGVQGGYVDLAIGQGADAGWVRIYGAKYYGASSGRVVEGLARAIEQAGCGGADYVIMIMHAGLEGVLDGYLANLSHHQIAPLRPYIDYLALGHIHKPYEREGWIYNPGSPETCSVDESAWLERGYYLVEVDSKRSPKHYARLVPTPRRAFLRHAINVAGCANQQELEQRTEQQLQAAPAGHKTDRPVVEVALEGVLAFDSNQLDIRRLQAIAERVYDALLVRVVNRTAPTGYEVRADETQPRAVLEREVLRELLERDARYQAAATAWADLSVNLKRMVLEGTSPASIVEYLDQESQRLMSHADNSH